MHGSGDWERLTSLATLGLARGHDALPPLPHDSLAPPDAAPATTTLLRNAAAAFIWKLAGERAVAGIAPETGTMPEERQVSASAVRRLARMLVDEPRDLVPEWLDLAARAGAVLPPAWVPAIFHALDPALRQRHAAIFGSSLARLGELDPQWTASAGIRGGGDDESTWATGSADDRIATLGALRARDAARGRSLVESTWDDDPPEFRERALAALRVGLNDDDETLLERALDDRRKPVRVAAAEALGRLRESAFVQRACARLEPHFVLQARGTGLVGRFTGRVLEITLPEKLDKTAQRDALEAKPPPAQKLGERTWWLVQMLAAVPPEVHLARFDCSIEDLLEAVRGTDHAAEIVDALALAAVRWGATDWVAPLFDAARSCATGPQRWQVLTQTMVPLLHVPPRAARPATLLARIDDLTRHDHWALAFDLLAMVDTDWPPELTQTALRVLEWGARNDATRQVLARNSLGTWARKVDPDTAEPLLARLVENLAIDAPWRKAVERTHELVLFRIDMRKELSA